MSDELFFDPAVQELEVLIKQAGLWPAYVRQLMGSWHPMDTPESTEVILGYPRRKRYIALLKVVTNGHFDAE